jgi:hypothetical protein
MSQWMIKKANENETAGGNKMGELEDANEYDKSIEEHYRRVEKMISKMKSEEVPFTNLDRFAIASILKKMSSSIEIDGQIYSELIRMATKEPKES